MGNREARISARQHQLERWLGKEIDMAASMQSNCLKEASSMFGN